MLNIAGSVPIFLYRPPTDMRKSFNSLSALVLEHLGSPTSGACYVFVNRMKTHVKILYWDGDGMVLWYKRLEQGTFPVPKGEADGVRLDRRDLAMLLEGVVPKRKRKRFSF